MNFVSTCAAGLEDLVVTELLGYGAEISTSRTGEIRWSGSLEAGYRTCLWSRVSSRLVLVLSEFTIASADHLYEEARATAWEDHLSVDDNFSVDCVLTAGGPVTNSMFGALRIKDGIVDRFRERRGRRPAVETKRPAVRVYLQVHGAAALLGLDLSGEALHRRGYRVDSGPAPLKENLAAAIIILSGWDTTLPLFDPMCGSGTLLIEAALIKADSAPGLGRTYYGLTGWRGHRKNVWEALVAEALDREASAQEKKWPSLIGFDGSRAAVRSARRNIASAGLDHRIRVELQELHQLRNSFGQSGVLVCNPPYGERVSDNRSVKHLYRRMGECFHHHFPGWQVTLLTAAPDYADRFKLSFDRSQRIYNGPLACRLFSGSSMPVAVQAAVKNWRMSTESAHDEATELGNRLKKNYRKFHSWACAENLDWYRIYDRDLPQFNVTIDVTATHLYIGEFPPPPEKDHRVAADRLREVIRTVRSLFGASRDQVAVHRSRTPRKGGKRGGATFRREEIREEGAVFLASRETGREWSFFPDQRFVRTHLAQTGGGGNLLAIFDTGGGAAIHAALGGAEKTVSLGIDQRNVTALQENFSRNGLHPENHRIISEPVLGWLKKNRQPFELIYICFRKKRYLQAKTRPFEAGPHHRFLIDRAVANLSGGGRLVVSSVLPAFELDPAVFRVYNCLDLSRKLASPDLNRSAGDFRCWEISSRELDERGAS